MSREPTGRLEGIEQVLQIDKKGARPSKMDNPEGIEKLDPVPGSKTPTPAMRDEDEKDDPPQKQEPPAEPKKKEPEPKESMIPDDILEDDGSPADNKEPEDTGKNEPEPNILTDDEVNKLDKKVGASFKHYRERAERAEKALKEAQAGQGKGVDTEALQELQKQLEERDSIIARLNLAESPQFKAKYTQQEQFLANAMKQQAGALEVDEKVIDLLTGMNMMDRAKYLNDNAPILKDVVMPYLVQWDMLQGNKKTELQNAAQNSQQFMEAHMKQAEAMREKTVNEVLSSVEDEGHFVFKKSSSNEEWNKTVDDSINLGKQILKSGDIKAQTKAVMLGAVAPVYLELWKAERSQRIAIQKQLESATGARPRVNASDDDERSSGRTPSVKPGEKMTAEQAAAQIGNRSKRFSGNAA